MEPTVQASPGHGLSIPRPQQRIRPNIPRGQLYPGGTALPRARMPAMNKAIGTPAARPTAAPLTPGQGTPTPFRLENREWQQIPATDPAGTNNVSPAGSWATTTSYARDQSPDGSQGEPLPEGTSADEASGPGPGALPPNPNARSPSDPIWEADGGEPLRYTRRATARRDAHAPSPPRGAPPLEGTPEEATTGTARPHSAPRPTAATHARTSGPSV